MSRPQKKPNAKFFSTTLRSKLTRESGTDFPIPVVPGVTESETEKLIREKDEEVRQADHELESHDQHDHEHESEHHEHSDAQPSAETRSDQIADEALWMSVDTTRSDHELYFLELKRSSLKTMN